MRVLVLGAAGYPGKPVADALVRAGHLVYAQSRDEKIAPVFAAGEMVPLISDPGSGTDSKVLALITSLAVDVVVDCLHVVVGLSVFDRIAEAASKARSPAYPLTYIYMSGTWVYGSTPSASLVNGLVDERGQPTNPAGLVAHRPALEEKILQSTLVNPTIVRPALFYGGRGGLLAPIFEAATKAGETGGTFEWVGREEGRFALIHIDDVADCVVRVAEASPLCSHLLLDIVNPITEDQIAFLKQLTKLTGARGYKIVEPKTLWDEALPLSTTIRPSLARALVGFEPRRAGLIDSLDVYYAAWRVGRKVGGGEEGGMKNGKA